MIKSNVPILSDAGYIASLCVCVVVLLGDLLQRVFVIDITIHTFVSLLAPVSRTNQNYLILLRILDVQFLRASGPTSSCTVKEKLKTVYSTFPTFKKIFLKRVTKKKISRKKLKININVGR